MSSITSLIGPNTKRGPDSTMHSTTSAQKGYAKGVLGGTGGVAGDEGFQSAIQQLLQQISGSPESRQAFEAPYLQQFNEQVIPGIAERFAGMGTGAGAGSSSALTNSLAQAGRSLQTDLAGMHEQRKQSALQQLLQYLGLASNERGQALGYQRPQSGDNSGLWGALAQGAGSIAGAYLGGPPGAVAGGQAAKATVNQLRA